ncbi:FAD-binding domain [Mycolicibacterium aichiense]|uniref:Oxidoreductase n=1 Tax=Mycolicibacterium aichiense TaxID=1799 RepID=A0AAD1MCW8_9MYCO|nr:FAD-binding domain [Mycolicibacterium aichiense]MCV7019470.1 FAD-binding domain [Mycolicibacterium aichiense]BBX08221.1 oxidoreductase [Mycolicibacterium aichiense]STZ82025.1 2-polyprenyl-6-methoxyphenol hydroxylase-like oxidoreductase [Mycolicibacterium aichiense]
MKIAISGAGVAGPTLAYWLHRCGHEPTLIERAPHFRAGGYLIDFWGVGYRVAQRMGVEPAIREAGYRLESLRSVGPDGRALASMKVSEFRRAARGELISVARGDLAAIIYASIEDQVEAIFDDSITAIDQNPGGVTLTFARTQPQQFDMLVGADGLHSNVRQLEFTADGSVERYLGCLVAAAVVEGYRPRDELVYMTYGRPGRSVSRFSLRGDRTLFLFVFRSDPCSDPGDLDARKELLWREFGDAGWECKQILTTLEDVDDLYFDVVSQIRMDRWSQGRVALIGDAAACVSLLAGEGTGLAMTAAYVLAGELHCAQGDHHRAFLAYESRMRPFIEDKQGVAKKLLPVFATKTEFGLRIRHLVMRAMNFGPIFDLVASGTLRDDFELPDYSM